MNYVIILVVLFFTACTSHYPSLKTVEQVDIKRYSGTWYEIARYEHFFEKGCSDVNATYTLKKDGDIEVLNQCMKPDGLSRAKGVAYAVDKTNAKLKVSFFRPFYGDYWILMLGDNYEYALIGEESREYLWVLSRTPAMDESLKEKIVTKLPEFGYGTEKLLWTKHSK
ncbi:lipocalin family protein [Sulfurimonas marina]|uniref:Lipocalin/cytosolic fatty-acid binding domain-containing protein n=1 Tax=Sulfurimonas marina TaxID=2590551 RepID=A0A7M1AUQ3_9BACT|nr:lipocalin family protein [Sulfurimonas marina]QOP41157.1 hypothetical protein FJR03_05130 [Sulfurimonas marina]